MKEIWKDIQGYKNLYQISNLGRVKLIGRDKKMPNGGIVHFDEQIMAPAISKDGYVKVSLSDTKGKRKSFRVHRLVANAFIENPDNKPQVNHLDENKQNNRVDNLNWVTAKENLEWNDLQSRMHKTLENDPRQSNQVIAIKLSNLKVTKFPSYNEVKRQGLVKSVSAVQAVVSPKYTKRYANGYTFLSAKDFITNQQKEHAFKVAHQLYIETLPKPILVTNVKTGASKIYESQREASKILGITKGNISSALHTGGNSKRI